MEIGLYFQAGMSHSYIRDYGAVAMDEANWSIDDKPHIGVALSKQVASHLNVIDEIERAHLNRRLQRYSDRHFFARRRACLNRLPSEARDILIEISQKSAALRDALQRVRFLDDAMPLVRHEARKLGLTCGTSLEGADLEFAAVKTVLEEAAKKLPVGRGQRGSPLLDNCVAAFMALFETIADARPQTCYSKDGIKGDYLAGRGGKALLAVFRCIRPDVSEATLARIVRKIDAAHKGVAMCEGDFDLISRLEDAGRFKVSVVQNL